MVLIVSGLVLPGTAMAALWLLPGLALATISLVTGERDSAPLPSVAALALLWVGFVVSARVSHRLGAGGVLTRRTTASRSSIVVAVAAVAVFGRH